MRLKKITLVVKLSTTSVHMRKNTIAPVFVMYHSSIFQEISVTAHHQKTASMQSLRVSPIAILLLLFHSHYSLCSSLPLLQRFLTAAEWTLKRTLRENMLPSPRTQMQPKILLDDRFSIIYIYINMVWSNVEQIKNRSMRPFQSRVE